MLKWKWLIKKKYQIIRIRTELWEIIEWLIKIKIILNLNRTWDNYIKSSKVIWRYWKLTLERTYTFWVIIKKSRKYVI